MTPDTDEEWPFSWSALSRGMNHLDVEWVQNDERRRAVEAITRVAPAMREMSARFAALTETLQQLRAAFGKIRETGKSGGRPQ